MCEVVINTIHFCELIKKKHVHAIEKKLLHLLVFVIITEHQEGKEHISVVKDVTSLACMASQVHKLPRELFCEEMVAVFEQ